MENLWLRGRDLNLRLPSYGFEVSSLSTGPVRFCGIVDAFFGRFGTVLCERKGGKST